MSAEHGHRTFRLNEDFTSRGKLTDTGRWYVTRFIEEVSASVVPGARVLDAGAGECAYKPWFAHCRYLGVDLSVGDGVWNYTNLDAFAALDALPFADESFDAVVSTQVLEHLEYPERCVTEMARVLKPGGRLLLTAPMAHFEHQVPHDFYRYTSFGLRSLVRRAGLSEPEIKPFGGMFTRWAYELPRAFTIFPDVGQRGGRFRPAALAVVPLRLVSGIVIRLLQVICLWLERFDKEKNDTLGWRLVAIRPLK